jgi:hypothetical protein
MQRRHHAHGIGRSPAALALLYPIPFHQIQMKEAGVAGRAAAQADLAPQARRRIVPDG